MEFLGDPSAITQNTVSSGLILIGALSVKLISSIGVRGIINRLEDDDPTTNTALEQRAYTLSEIIKSTLNIVIFGIATIMILSQWGVNVTPILTGAGVIGLAIGFGAQALVKDTINGFFILLENQFNVGDRVKIGGLEGTVMAMKLRVTVLREKEGTTHTVPNSKIDTVTKFSS
jgi:moderate conductance mechanosensitive channel